MPGPSRLPPSPTLAPSDRPSAALQSSTTHASASAASTPAAATTTRPRTEGATTPHPRTSAVDAVSHPARSKHVHPNQTSTAAGVASHPSPVRSAHTHRSPKRKDATSQSNAFGVGVKPLKKVKRIGPTSTATTASERSPRSGSASASASRPASAHSMPGSDPAGEAAPASSSSSHPPPQQQQQQQQPQSKAKRVRTGCLTCRERHLKCDEGTPDCNNCRKSNRHCKRGLKLNFIDTWAERPPVACSRWGTPDWRVQFLDESREIAAEYEGGAERYPPLPTPVAPVAEEAPPLVPSLPPTAAPPSTQHLPPIPVQQPDSHGAPSTFGHPAPPPIGWRPESSPADDAFSGNPRGLLLPRTTSSLSAVHDFAPPPPPPLPPPSSALPHHPAPPRAHSVSLRSLPPVQAVLHGPLPAPQPNVNAAVSMNMHAILSSDAYRQQSRSGSSILSSSHAESASTGGEGCSPAAAPAAAHLLHRGSTASTLFTVPSLQSAETMASSVSSLLEPDAAHVPGQGDEHLPAPPRRHSTAAAIAPTAHDRGSKEYLTSGIETLYMQVFVEEVALWMDSMDPLKHFSRLLPFHSLSLPMLHNAFLACGARQLSLVQATPPSFSATAIANNNNNNPAAAAPAGAGAATAATAPHTAPTTTTTTPAEAAALHYYDTATTHLLRALQDPARDPVLCATTAVVLNVYEVMSDRALQRMNHIAGARALIKECGWHARTPGVGGACFWLNVGFEVMSCLRFRWSLAWPPAEWGMGEEVVVGVEGGRFPESSNSEGAGAEDDDEDETAMASQVPPRSPDRPPTDGGGGLLDFAPEKRLHREEVWTHRILYVLARLCDFRAALARLANSAATAGHAPHRLNTHGNSSSSSSSSMDPANVSPRTTTAPPGLSPSHLRAQHAEWRTIKSLADAWEDGVPRTMQPLAYVPAAATRSGSAFPEIWLVKRATITARLFYHTAMLLLAQTHVCWRGGAGSAGAGAGAECEELETEEHEQGAALRRDRAAMRALEETHARLICGIVAHGKDR